MKVILTGLGRWLRVDLVMEQIEQKDPRLEALRSAPMNTWVALSEDESKIVAVGSTFAEAVSNSEHAGVADPLIVKTPSAWIPLSV